MTPDKAYLEAEQRIETARKDEATELDLSNIGLTDLPEAISQLTNLEVLDIGNDFWKYKQNRLTKLPESLSNLSKLRSLNLNHNQLTTLPNWLSNLSELESLYFDDNQITRLPEWLSNLSKLELLHFDDNQITNLPEWLSNLSELKSLHFDDNQITELPEWLGSLSKLQSLHFSNNELTILPDCLGTISELKSLHLGKNQLKKIPHWLSNLSKLQSLYFGENQIKELPEWLCNLISLRFLSVSKNQLTTLPEFIGNLSSLELLHIDKNQLTMLPESIGNLSSLELLHLDNNQLTTLPESIGNLSNLKSLHLDDNQLAILPESLGNLSNLELLHLSNNKLSILIESLGNLYNLKLLDLDDNQLTTLPDSIGNLSNLKLLRINTNGLTILPESLCNLTHLKSFQIAKNKLKALPENIGTLKQLETLRIWGNEITVLPDSLGKLKNLKDLFLDNPLLNFPSFVFELKKLKTLALGSCGFEQLPESFEELTEIHTLFLQKNKLNDLPVSLSQLPHLAQLEISHNPLNPELAAANKQGIEAIKAYLKAKADGKIVLNEAKLILVGEGEVGKSCLLGALRGDKWIEGRPTTHGIEIKPIITSGAENETEITLNGWDFGGQRVYRPTHQLFFSSPAVYLVVWKPREGPQQGFVKEWITLIKHREPDAKVLVVATHGGPKQRQPDIDKQELIDLFGEDTIQGFFFVDSKPSEEGEECQGINILKKKIAEVSAALPGMGRTIPAKWHKVREALRITGKPYIPYKDAIEICEENGVEGFLAEQCIRVYHRLGNIVHYHYDPLLKDIVILKPDWLAKAISFVLDDKETRRRNGLVEFEHLSQLWSNPSFEGEEGYPKDLHPIFLRLMERFDLSYKVVLDASSKEESTTSLIAQLVQDNRPECLPWGNKIEEGERQQVQICRIVDNRGQLANAEGIFYQLIVRLHKYSLGRDNYEKSVHWQRGLMLDDDYNGRALLEHIGTNIHITVRAAYPEFFLHQLTREVKWLVENFWEGLRCEIVVPCIAPCGKNQPGLGQFEVQKLIASKSKGRVEFPCNVSGCDEWQNIDELMRNAPTAQETPQTMLSEQLSEMKSELQKVRQDIRLSDRFDHKRFQTLSQGQKEILSKLDREFSTLMQMSTDEAKEGPRLFSFKPLEPGFFERPKWMGAKFQLTLWCEHSRKPLPTLNSEQSKQGVYELILTREWLTKAAPYLKFMTTTIGLVLPVAASATKAILDDTAYKSIEEELDLAQKSIEFSVKGSDIAVDCFTKTDAPDIDADIEDWGESTRAEGSMLRQLHALLKEKDPGFGGLVRVQNKRQEFLWVHPQFVKEY